MAILLLCSFLLFEVHAALKGINQMKSPFELGPLPMPVNSLAPKMDEEALSLHYSQNHRSQVEKLNESFKEPDVPLIQVLFQASKKTDVVRNNAGGHWNHTFFWEELSSREEDRTIPPPLKKEIEKRFGSVSNFKSEYERAALKLEGAGWVWLVRNLKGELEITTTINDDNPLMDDVLVRGTPIVGTDMWEHAYYLKYKNDRVAYLKNFWDIVNWNQVYEWDRESGRMSAQMKKLPNSL